MAKAARKAKVGSVNPSDWKSPSDVHASLKKGLLTPAEKKLPASVRNPLIMDRARQRAVDLVPATARAAPKPTPPASDVAALAVKVKAAIASSSRSVLEGVQRELASTKLSKGDAIALAKATGMHVPKSSSGKAAVAQVQKRLSSLSTFMQKQSAMSGRSAAGIAIAVGAGLLSALGNSGSASASQPDVPAPAAAPSPPKPPVERNNLFDAHLHSALTVGSVAVVKAGVDMIRAGAAIGGPKSVLAKLGGAAIAAVGTAAAGLNAAAAVNSASRANGGVATTAQPPAAYLNDAARQKAQAVDATQPSQAAVQPNAGSGPIDVPGYTRADGTVVKGYSRQRSF